MSGTQEDEERESGLRRNTGKRQELMTKIKKKKFVTFIKSTQAPMFPLPIASDLKLRASCADSERLRARDTRAREIIKSREKEKVAGRSTKGSQVRGRGENTTILSIQDVFWEPRGLETILCTSLWGGVLLRVWVASFMLLTRIG